MSAIDSVGYLVDDPSLAMSSDLGSLGSLRDLGFFKGVSDNALVCALSLATINYNLAVTSYVVYYLVLNEGINPVECAYVVSTLLMGLMVGQILFGVLGDVLGRKRCFWTCIFLMLKGSIISLFAGLLFIGLVTELTIMRTILMIGAGGLYPLVATITKESSQQSMIRTTVAMIFGPLGSLGLVMAPLVVIMVSWCGFSPGVTWRLILGTGIIPILWLSTYNVTETHNESLARLKVHDDGGATVYSHLCEALFVGFQKEVRAIWKPPLRSLMLGTTFSWFFSDILFYGNFLMQALIIKTIIDEADSDDEYLAMTTIAGVGLISSVLFWFGGILSVNSLKHTSALGLQLQGFIVVSLVLLIFVAVTTLLPWNTLSTILFLVLYISVYFFIGYGPAPSTFIVPSIVFPKQLRNTANGVSAGVGKLGAIIFIFMSLKYDIDARGLMAFQCGACFLGSASTIFTMKAYNTCISISRQRAAHTASRVGALDPSDNQSSNRAIRRTMRESDSEESSMDEAYYSHFRDQLESDPLLGGRR